MKNTLKTVLLYAAVVLVIIFAVSLMLSSSNKTAPTYGDIIDLFTAGKVTEFDVNRKIHNFLRNFRTYFKFLSYQRN